MRRSLRNAGEEREKIFREVFEEVFGVHLSDFGVRVVPRSDVHLFAFDARRVAFVPDIKFVRSPHAIRNALRDRVAVLHALVGKKTLKPPKAFASLFDALFPEYRTEFFGRYALVHSPAVGLVLFTKDAGEFGKPVQITSRFLLHKAIRPYVLPLKFLPDKIKPVECLTELALARVRRINEALCRLGCPDFSIFQTESGIILEFGEGEMYVLCSEDGKVKKGDLRSRVYKEYVLFRSLEDRATK